MTEEEREQQNQGEMFAKESKREQFKRFLKTEEKFLPEECMICFTKIGTSNKIWNCKSCRIVTHLKCVKEWTGQLKVKLNIEGKYFNCFHCNERYENQEPTHTCYCGKTNNPVINSYLEPNSCGNVCGLKLSKFCFHKCQEVCHIGNCKPCEKENLVDCNCKKQKIVVKCKDFLNFEKSCNQKCGKVLNCGRHHCEEVCHSGACQSCNILSEVECHCQKTKKSIFCGESFSCEMPCEKYLTCGNHQCFLKCHEDKCPPCDRSLKPNETCHCGQVKVRDILKRERTSCLEEIPSCQQICIKPLDCGHKCIKRCHEGICDCGLKKESQCYCGELSIIRQCNMMDQIRCKTVCDTKLKCKNHRCTQICCPGKNQTNFPSHKCHLLCGKQLSCQHHECTDPCHTGNCKTCDVIINRPITCACGQQILKPPQICGTESPICMKICNKRLPCGHNCYFNCHLDECRNCEEILNKVCKCGSSQIENVKCSEEARCTKLCQSVLPCGHLCNKMCHQKGECLQLI